MVTRTTAPLVTLAASSALLLNATIAGMLASPAAAADFPGWTANRIVLACAPGLQAFEVPPQVETVDVYWRPPGCSCFLTAESAVAWIQGLAEKTRRMPNGSLVVSGERRDSSKIFSSFTLAPGERKEVGYFCYSQDQVTAYLEAAVPRDPKGSAAP